MPLNRRLLRKVRNRIAKIPESYSQNVWVMESGASPCGAVACLAGETVIANAVDVQTGIKTLLRWDDKDAPSRSAFAVYIPYRAAKLLGLNDDDAMAMFRGNASGWPKPFRIKFVRARSNQRRAEVAVGYLDECLRRGRVTW